MADEDTSDYVPLEDQTADPEPEPEAQAPPVEAQPPPEQVEAAAPLVEEQPEADDDDLEAKAIPDRLTNELRVPLAEVREWRRKAVERRQEAETLSAKVKELEAQAARAGELEGQLRQVQAWAQAQARQPQQPPQPQPDPRQVEREQARQQRAESLAKTLDLYTPEGKPDTERGLKLLQFNEALAKEQAEAMVQPLRRQTAESRAMSNRAALSAHLQKIGAKVDTRLFDQLWDHLGPELAQQQEVAAVAAAAALGWPLLFGTQAPAQVQQQVQQAAPRSPVVVTEPIQQRAPAAPRLTGIAARAAKDAGMTAEQVEKAYGRPSDGVIVLASDVE